MAPDSEAWRAHTAWVPQRPTPTQPTVAAEVRLGDPDATAEQVERAVAQGASLVSAGEREGNVFPPAVLTGARQGFCAANRRSRSL